MQVITQSSSLAARSPAPQQQPGGRRARIVTSMAGRQFRTIREDIDKSRLKKQGVIKTVKGGPEPKAPARQQQQLQEGPNYALIAGALLVPLALWLALGQQ